MRKRIICCGLGAVLLCSLLLPLSISDYDGTNEQAFHMSAPLTASDLPEGRRTAADRSRTDDIEPLTIATQQLSGMFNPFFAENGYDSDIVTYTQAPLISINHDGSPAAGVEVFSVAYSFDILQNEDGSESYVFVIKNGVSFSDGHMLDAEDVLFNLYVYLDPAYDGPAALGSLDIAGLSEYRAQEAKSISGISCSRRLCDDGAYRDAVSITLNSPDASAVWKFAFAVAPMHYYAGSERHARANGTTYFGVDFSSTDFMRELRERSNAPMGAGPYRISDYYGGSDASSADFWVNGVCYFAANDDFMLGAPCIRRLWVKTVTSASKTDALLQGQIDVCSSGASESLLASLSSDVSYSSVGSVLTDTMGYGFICVNSAVIPNALERAAILSAMDVSRTAALYGDQTALLYRPMSSLSWAYPEDVSAYYLFDDSGATALDCYSRMGYSRSEDGVMRDLNGQPIEYIFTLPSDTSSHPSGAIFLDAQRILAQIGIRVTIKTDPELLSSVFDSAVAVWSAEWRTDPDPDLFPLFYSDSSRNSSAYPGVFGLYRLFSEGSEEERATLSAINSLILSARAITDRDRRKALYSDALDRIMELCVILPTYQKKTLWLYNKERINSATLTPSDAYHAPFDNIWNISLRDAG